MFHLPRLTSATKRTTLVLLLICLSGIGSLAAPNEPTPARTSLDAVAANEVLPTQTQQRPPASPTQTPGVMTSPAQERQTQQGRQYGQPGFVGEPINLNVVNADIRDILNYITEQYGVNFVIDSSVGAVNVTVNVQDVPWNVALDAVLKANRLGIEVNGNILRVATNDVLAKEADTEKIINDSHLDNADLVTEFIRLNYARACGSLAHGGGPCEDYAGRGADGAASL